MVNRRRLGALTVGVISLVVLASRPDLFLVRAQTLAPLAYTIRFPDTASRSFTVEVAVPAGKRGSIDMMMPVWSPGFYGLQTYGDRVSNVAATAGDGTTLEVSRSSPSRWTIKTGGRSAITVSYTVAAARLSNLGNGVTDTGAALIGLGKLRSSEASSLVQSKLNSDQRNVKITAGKVWASMPKA